MLLTTPITLPVLTKCTIRLAISFYKCYCSIQCARSATNKGRYIFTLKLDQYYRQLFHTTSNYLFWERDVKSGYGQEKNTQTKTELIRNGLKELRYEIELWKQEMKEKWESDPILLYRPGEVDIIWKFDEPENFVNWVTTSDSDHGEGYSKCQLSRSPNSKALFSGTLNNQLPKDGRIKKAGYCNLKSMRLRKSFKRDAYFDWRMYTHLVMRIRGDGRSYLLNISTMGYFDILWNDIYHYALFTRGGPYWQVAKIPFSKFFLGSKGRVQDRQYPIPLDKVASFGISVADNVNGPFQLEIDYIGVEFDPTHTEEFAYEMYKTDKYIVAH